MISAGDSQAELVLPSTNLNEDVEFLKKIGFRLNNVYPADDPAVARLSGHGMCIRLNRSAHSPVPVVNILTDHPQNFADGKNEIVAPNGTVFKIQSKSFHLEIPKIQNKFQVCRLEEGAKWVTGRAGMLYRDLIPGRLGGAIIASHIRIPNGGPVQDVVHYHTIRFQLIYCYKGWVKVVYEDQGPPFVLEAGDCVTQPPEIRHCVLESSKNMEVIEIGVPAQHLTTVDHEMELPTPTYLPSREFSGQQFCHHQLKKATWIPWWLDGFQFRETGVCNATKALASVHVARPLNNGTRPPLLSHNADIYFNFVLDGEMELYVEGHGTYKLSAEDTYVIPPGLKHQICEYSKNLELLEVVLPGDFHTIKY